MRTVVHLSDLHFGRTDPQMVAHLRTRLHQLQPALVIVSGDLTQRARTTEFEEARAFLDTITAPLLVIPGNHDIELYNLYGRFVERLQRYKKYISEDTEPFYSNPELVAVCVNTARSLTFKGGRINAAQVDSLRQRFQSAHPGAIKILVAHHPLDLPATFTQALVGRARMALNGLSGCGIDLILSGHLHISRFSAPADRLRIGGHTALLVQAGTAVSTRSRGELNSFNVIEAAPGQITIQKHCWSHTANEFSRCTAEEYRHSPTGWRRTELQQASVPE